MGLYRYSDTSTREDAFLQNRDYFAGKLPLPCAKTSGQVTCAHGFLRYTFGEPLFPGTYCLGGALVLEYLYCSQAGRYRYRYMSAGFNTRSWKCHASHNF